MGDFLGKAVVVTGAASGIGREIARAFADRGARLAICDIDGRGLGELQAEVASAGRRCYQEIVDVAQAGQVEEFCANVYREMGRVDVLVNNAGIACGGRFETMSLDDWQWILGVNLWGVIHGCHFFYPRMIGQGGRGHIINIASAAGLNPFPFMSAYCVTKSAVLAISRTLRAEAALNGIGVSAICPGFVNTNIIRTAKVTCGTRRSSAEELLGTVNRLYGLVGWPPERVARAAIKAVEKDLAVVRVGFETYLVDAINRLAPRLVDRVNRQAFRFGNRWL